MSGGRGVEVKICRHKDERKEALQAEIATERLPCVLRSGKEEELWKNPESKRRMVKLKKMDVGVRIVGRGSSSRERMLQRCREVMGRCQHPYCPHMRSDN